MKGVRHVRDEASVVPLQLGLLTVAHLEREEVVNELLSQSGLLVYQLCLLSGTGV